MAKKRIADVAMNVMRDVAGAALDAAAEEARRVVAQTVANTAARLEERAKDALPAVEGAVRKQTKRVDRALGTRTAARKTGAKRRKRGRRSRKSRAKRHARRRRAARSASRIFGFAATPRGRLRAPVAVLACARSMPRAAARATRTATTRASPAGVTGRGPGAFAG